MNINLEIEPKFHKGQTIWIVDHIYWNNELVARWGTSKGIVKDVTISIGKGYYNIVYQISEECSEGEDYSEDEEYSEGEEWCFATEEEAKEYCRKRNKENL